MIIIVFGLPGSGKSYFASRLADALNACYIKSDQVRREIMQQRTYSEKEKMWVYDAMLQQVIAAVKQGKRVVVDATFHKEKVRQNFITHIPVTTSLCFIEVMADEPVIRERLTMAREDSDADFDVYKKIKGEWEPLHEPHLQLHSNNTNIHELLLTATNWLRVNYG